MSAEASSLESVMDLEAQRSLVNAHGVLKLAANELLNAGAEDPTPEGVTEAVLVAREIIKAQLERAGAL